MEPYIYDLNHVRECSAKNLFNVVSFFAGGGGSSTGYRLAGGKILAINEFIPAAVDVYSANYPDTYIFPGDIRELTGQYVLDTLGLKVGELDILDGSPPCSSFSMAGLREKGWGREKKYSDSKQRTDDLFFEFARILKEIQPKVFICENVKGLTLGAANNLLGNEQINMFGEEDTIYNALVNAGYRVRFKVLNAAHYGVPQSRERLIFIGVRNDINKPITFPITKSNRVTLKEAFKGLEWDGIEGNIEKYSIYKLSKTLRPGEGHEKRFNLVKMHPDKVSPTITATNGSPGAAGVVHWDNRKPSVAETIRICSFPDDYYLGEIYQKQIERLGRAVPPLMMKAVAEHVYKTILYEPAE